MAFYIATSLGEKTMEIAEKVATDSAEELKKASAEFGSLPGKLDGILCMNLTK